MLESVKNAIRSAKIAGIAEMLNTGEYYKRSLAALAKGIGESESDTEAFIAAGSSAVRTTGRVSGKVFYSLDN